GSELEVALEVGHRLREQGQSEMDQAAVTNLLRPIRCDAQEELLDPQRHVEIALLMVDPLEIVNHSLKNLPVPRPLQELGPERHLSAVHLLEKVRAFLLGQDLSAIERIDQDVRDRR